MNNPLLIAGLGVVGVVGAMGVMGVASLRGPCGRRPAAAQAT